MELVLNFKIIIVQLFNYFWGRNVLVSFKKKNEMMPTTFITAEVHMCRKILIMYGRPFRCEQRPEKKHKY